MGLGFRVRACGYGLVPTSRSIADYSSNILLLVAI